MEEKKFEGNSKVIVNIDSIHCADCALNIERSVEHLPGVLSAEVSYVLSSATIHYDPHRGEEDQIKRAITKPGYVVRETLTEKTRTFWNERRPFIFTTISGITLGLSWILGWIDLKPAYLPTAFALASLVIGGYPVLKSAIKALFIPDLNVDTLVSIAAIAATSVGAYQEAATVVFIMLLGEFLETWLWERRERPLPRWFNFQKTVLWFGIPASLAAGLLLGIGIGFLFRFGSSPLETKSSPAASAPAWSGPVSLVLLERPTRGASRTPRFRVDAGQPFIPLAVPVVVPESAGDAEMFRFTVRDEGDRVLWWSDVTAAGIRQQIAASGVVSFLVPAPDLQPGRKTLRFARAMTPEPATLLEIPFEISVTPTETR